MRGKQRQRLIIDRRGAEGAGRSPYGPHFTASQIRGADFETTITHLPVNPADVHMLQTEAGVFYWTLGIDDFESEAVLS